MQINQKFSSVLPQILEFPFGISTIWGYTEEIEWLICITLFVNLILASKHEYF